MDEQYLIATTRHIEMNLVAAKMLQGPEDYPWSSARAHLQGEDDQLVNVVPLLQLIPDRASFFSFHPMKR
jgi:putative transposase